MAAAASEALGALAREVTGGAASGSQPPLDASQLTVLLNELAGTLSELSYGAFTELPPPAPFPPPASIRAHVRRAAALAPPRTPPSVTPPHHSSRPRRQHHRQSRVPRGATFG